MRSHRFVFLAVLISAFFMFGAASQAAYTRSKSMDRTDHKFIKKAAESGMKEMKLGELAEQRAQSPDVKQFGKMMVDNHTTANAELMTLAQEKGIAVPEKLTRMDQMELNHLSKVDGPKFDREYMKLMVKDHEKAIKAFQKESAKGKDTDLVTFAKNTLPTLEQHLNHAESIDSTLTK